MAWAYTFSRFGTVPACDRRTDRQTRDDSIYQDGSRRRQTSPWCRHLAKLTILILILPIRSITKPEVYNVSHWRQRRNGNRMLEHFRVHVPSSLDYNAFAHAQHDSWPRDVSYTSFIWRAVNWGACTCTMEANHAPRFVLVRRPLRRIYTAVNRRKPFHLRWIWALPLRLLV